MNQPTLLISWYNFKTKEYDEINGMPGDFADYIPQSEAAQNMYNLLLEMSHSKDEAALMVLNAGLPKEENQ